ncbi:hypothetical protein BC826DRAFT_1187913 [Russula brevipes]|nr:hypothetical protein BC826DRAFT_1187913 [Russula brevipes]
MTRVAERHPSHPQNTSSISSSTTHSDTTARFLHESDVQGSKSSEVLLTRLESLSNRIRSIVRTPSTRAVALSTVDTGIEAAMLLTRALFTHRNTLAPISVLPAEVLTRIFHLVAFAESSRSSMGSLRWIGITHVCRHWRQVALDDSSLWARISSSTARPTWVSEVLARARNAPLAIELFTTSNAETLSMFAAHFARTHEFRLRGIVASTVDDNIREICSLEAPALEHFELGAAPGSPVTFLRAPFFNGMAPKLRTFSLYQIRVPWSFIPRGQLSELKITFFNGERIAEEPSFRDSRSLVDLLINCPVLEILVLESCLPQTITPPSHVQAIHLPRLSYLSLCGASSRVANLLGILKLPPSTTLRVVCNSENTTTNNDHLLPLVSAHFHDPPSVEIKSFDVSSGRTSSWITFAAFTYLPTVITYRYAVEHDLSGGGAWLELSFYVPFEDEVDILGQVCSMLPLSNIEFLSINHAFGMDRSVNWSELFQRCAKLTTIEANGRGASCLLKELAPPKPKKAASGEKGRKRKLNDRRVPASASSSHTTTANMPVPIFPNLTCLFINDHHLCEPAHHPGASALYDALLTMLRRRRACKVPLKMLKIEDCFDQFITTDRAKALRKLVPKFLQYGIESDGSSLDESDDFDDLSDVGTSTEDSWGD